MRGLLGVLFTGVVALTAGAIGFQAGIASNIGAAGGAVYLGGGIPGLGFLVFLLFVGFLLFAIGGGRRAWARGPMGGPGHWGGHGPWGTDGDPRRAWVADAHRRLHEEEARADGTTGTPGPASPTDRPAAG
ncbi:MAG TPA: hypothetical protein VES19_08625 [Candidatus Limnocylindrales bacterium]|nr:hypothetical protein [Candidatus Limnocylindrales bacterium]